MKGIYKLELSDILSGYLPYEELCRKIKADSFPIEVSGICESAEGHFISSVASRRSAVICYTDMEAASLYKELSFYADNVYHFPSKEPVVYNIDAAGKEAHSRRLRSLYAWESGGIMVTSVDAVMQYTVSPEKFRSMRLSFKVGETCDLQEIRKKLTDLGYLSSAEVDGVGLFSVRGGIIDIFSPNMKLPVRIELFDDEIDSVRFFDWETQRSVENIDEAVITPAAETVLTDTERKRLIEILEGLSERFPDDDDLKSELDKARDGLLFPSIDKYIGAASGAFTTFADYIEDDLVFLVDSERINDRIINFNDDKAELYADLYEKGILRGDIKLFADSGDIISKTERKRIIKVNALGGGIDFSSRQTVSFHGKIDYLYEDMKKWAQNGETSVILATVPDKAKNLFGVISEKGYDCKLCKGREIEKGKINICVGSVKSGFEYPGLGFILISDREIFDGGERRARRKTDNAKRIKSYNDIHVGDFVVHQVHGIGVYDGIKKMTVSGVTKDYLKVNYRDNDVLYVPIDQLDLLYKYAGSDDSKARVSKLGGKEWTKTKQRVKKSTDDMAKRLVKLYAQRENSKGYAFSRDTVWQRDFEDEFVYSETEDQLRSIEEVKADMESDKPMDRLLCGDVGYGKTEVALRAAFKAVTDSKQVAYLCPTTILAMQHYNTFSERMRNFPIKVEMLSRFRTKAQQTKILKALKSGEIDIIIGTHRIVQKDVEFKDLGLLIIDEEQRFGVAHKERLKEMKQNIDVLSMTATPIPRTLHMSMISVRDMSVLTQPPQNRYPVQTYVLEKNKAVLTDAIRRELSRGGQVFYMHNRIQGIYKTAQWIQDAFPDKVVRVGHGQMSETELEDIMNDMVMGYTDILVCTTIIETGLDIPNANTIIIENADRMGLSQLYQLRGRVGRSNKKAYAYLTYERDKSLSEVASKRLQAIKEFTEFGSGFKIALKDLEIRGAGDILGAQQHGHMDSVGYDLYCKILKRSVDEARGEIAEKEDFQTSIDIGIDAYLPERYVADSAQRIDIYKKISSIETLEDKMEITDELIDRYGDLPTAAKNVVEIGYVKACARNAGISEIAERGKWLNIKFGSVDVSVLLGLAQSNPSKYKLVPGDVPQMNIRLDSNNKLKEISEIIDLLPQK